MIFLIGLTLASFVMVSGVEGALQGTGTTYYVNAELGDDSNGGTSKPKASAPIDKANALDLDPGAARPAPTPAAPERGALA